MAGIRTRYYSRGQHRRKSELAWLEHHTTGLVLVVYIVLQVDEQNQSSPAKHRRTLFIERPGTTGAQAVRDTVALG